MPQKNRIIDEIRELNPSAEHQWLESFSIQELEHYRDHLRITLEPASSARWIRRSDLAPVTMRESA